MINASENRLAESFQSGDVVTIYGGHIAGYEGIFNARFPGRDRVEVLLQMLQGSQIRVELRKEQIILKKSSFLGTKRY